jgi:hypothetical protein
MILPRLKNVPYKQMGLSIHLHQPWGREPQAAGAAPGGPPDVLQLASLHCNWRPGLQPSKAEPARREPTVAHQSTASRR